MVNLRVEANPRERVAAKAATDRAYCVSSLTFAFTQAVGIEKKDGTSVKANAFQGPCACIAS